jgi:hypothetical protein
MSFGQYLGHGPDHQGRVRLGKIAVDFVHLQQPVLGNLDLGQQHVHVSGHAAVASATRVSPRDISLGTNSFI